MTAAPAALPSPQTCGTLAGAPHARTGARSYRIEAGASARAMLASPRPWMPMS